MSDSLSELEFCLNLWSTWGYCNFGGRTNCSECGCPYLLWKYLTGEVLHDSDMERLTVVDWNRRLESYKHNLNDPKL